MLEISIPGAQTLRLIHLVVDFNGTLFYPFFIDANGTRRHCCIGFPTKVPAHAIPQYPL